MTENKYPSTVLAVDDDVNLVASVARLFHGQGFTLLTANSGEEALEIMEARPIQLILCDESMPGIRGNVVLREVKERWPDTIRIMMTANPDLNLALKTINEDEAYRFILKPWNDTELLIIVKQGLERYHLIHENRLLAEKVRIHEETLASLEKQTPGITHVAKDKEGYYVASTK
jgi:DNA-binding NtrC family response regulator